MSAPNFAAAFGCLLWLFGLTLAVAIWSTSDCDLDALDALFELEAPR